MALDSTGYLVCRKYPTVAAVRFATPESFGWVSLVTFQPYLLYISLEGLQKLPATHSLFSSLPWIRNAALMATTLDENDENTGQFTSLEAQTHVFKALDDPQDAINADEKYWLEEDDISEF